MSSVVEKFPEQSDIIVKLYEGNEDFRELCDHYLECKIVLSTMKSRQELELLDEYNDLTKELEQEIQKIVDSVT